MITDEKRCPELHVLAARDDERDKVYEGYYCRLNDKPCVVEYGSEFCETYNEFLKEELSESPPAANERASPTATIDEAPH